MSKLIYFMPVSPDGFIAGETDSMEERRVRHGWVYLRYRTRV